MKRPELKRLGKDDYIRALSEYATHIEEENERLKDQRENTVFMVNAFLDVIAYQFSVSLKSPVSEIGEETRVALIEVIRAINE